MKTSCSTWWVYGLLIACMTVCLSPAANAQETTADTVVQTIALQEGWNLVSLSVTPHSTDPEVLIDPILEHVPLVRGSGNVFFMPGVDLNTLEEWRPHEAYFVYAESAVVWEVEGTPLNPPSLSLDEGWNLVPYLLSDAVAVEEGLSSILSSMLIADDAAGNVFIPELNIQSLDSLRAGQGYQVYVEAADTLHYQMPNEPITVPTLADALALTGLNVGDTVEVEGYHEPGDGGGGLFEVTVDACATDGGTCFVLDEDISEEEVVELRTDFRSPIQFSLPDGSGAPAFVWGTVVVDVAASEPGGPTTDLLTWEHHHGHTFKGGGTPMVNWEAGIIGGSGMYLRGARSFVIGIVSQQSVDWVVRYKYSLSDRRLKRIGITDTVSLAWWGTPKADVANPQNAGPYLNHAINKAKELQEAGNLEWAYVDIPGHYYYRYNTLMIDSVMLRGTGEPNAEGYKGQLTIVPGLAMDHLKTGGETIRSAMGMQDHDLTTQNILSGKIGAQDIEFFGNIAGNEDAIYDPNNEYGNVDDRIQNANQWNGLVGPPDAERGSVELHFTDIYMHDYPGNGIAAANRFDVTPSDNVRLGNAPSNHQTYHAGVGTYTNWSIEGSAWDTMHRFDDATFVNLEFKNIREGEFWSPFGKEWSALFDHEPRFIDSSNSLVDGFTVDMSGGNNRSARIVSSNFLYENGSNHLTLRDGTISTLENHGTTLFSPRGPYTQNPVGGIHFENITMTNAGGGMGMFGGLPHSHVRFENITFDAVAGASGGGLGSINYFNYPQHVQAGRIDIVNFQMLVESDVSLIKPGSYSIGDQAYDIFISESFLLNGSSNPSGDRITAPIYGSVGSLSDAERQGAAETTRIYIYNSSILTDDTSTGPHQNFVHFDYFTGLGFKERVGKLRSVVDQDGRTSEDSGTFSSSAPDEGNHFVLIPTNLISYAFETDVTLQASPAGISSVVSVEVANSDGSLRSDASRSGQWEPYLKVTLDGTLGAGETVTLDWTARVTPLSEFSPTGLFVPRPVKDQAIDLGGGAVEIDLRGVAASMESDEAIVYTATTSDASVAEVAVEDGYRLIVTPQATGSSTVTITGGIDGVGSATDTFDVTVE